MNQMNVLSKCVFTLAMICSLNLSAQSAPAEKLSTQIKRSASTAAVANDFLTQNYYKTTQFCAQYGLVDVPYQETEYTTESVPYTVDIPYIVSVPYTVNVPYTEWVTDYRTEQQCHSVQKTKNVCHIEQECYLVPGGKQCRDKSVCQNILVPAQECTNVQVPYQHEVTKYRQETQYRDETRYRQETRYRDETVAHQVTKYHQEQQCVDTKTVKTFDHQARFNLVVIFPLSAVLQPNDQEILNLKLISTSESKPQVRLDVVSSIYSYRIKQQNLKSGVLVVELEIYDSSALLQQADLAELKKGANLSASLIGHGLDSALVLTDLTKEFNDVNTNYSIYLDLIKVDGTSKPLNMKSFARDNLKSANMMVKLSDIIGYAQVSKTALVYGNVIEVSIIAKRTGANSILGANSVKAEKILKVIIQ